MDEFWANALQPIVVSLATVAILALLRLITPSVRWGRRLKAETEIFSSLPEGLEREFWAQRVEAQAERLRIYRESFTFQAAAKVCFAFLVLVSVALIVVVESVSGWALTREIVEDSVYVHIPVLAMLFVLAVVALIILVRLILGGTMSSVPDGRGMYPKMDALLEEEERRLETRRRSHQRFWKVEIQAAQERRDARRKARRGRSAT